MTHETEYHAAGLEAPTDVADRLGEALSLDLESKTFAREVTRVVQRSQWAQGKPPSSVAAACVYASGLVLGSHISQEDVREAGGPSTVTIRTLYPDVPGLVVEYADEDDYARMDEALENREAEWYEPPEDVEAFFEYCAALIEDDSPLSTVAEEFDTTT